MQGKKLIEERQQFLDLADHILEKNRNKYSEYGEWEKPHIKTYLIESNVDKIKNVKDNIPTNFKLNNTTDEGFYRLSSNKYKNGGFIDTSHGRIWKFYSTFSSNISDKFMRHWVDKTLYLDRCWYPNQHLEKLEKDYRFRGIGINFIDYFDEGNRDDRSKISLKLWTKGSLKEHERKIYDFVEDKYTRKSTRIQHIHEEKSNFLKEVFFNGKITTTYARSPEDIVNFSNKLIKDYQENLKKIEEERGAFSNPIELIFEEKLPIKKIVNYFRSGKKPFRLWLTDIDQKDDFARLFGVDLHTGDKIGLDIGRDYIWINLPKKTCGNAGLRIPTLLAFSFPYRVDIKIGGEDLIA